MGKVFALLGILFISGCSTSIPVNYVPAPIIKGEGDITVGTVNYIPAIQGKVKQNQMQKATGAIGNIYTTVPVPEIVKKALQKELTAAGFTVNEASDTQIDISIDKFLYDWIGFVEVDFYTDMTFTVTKQGIEVAKYEVKAHQAAPKTPSMSTDSEAIKSTLSTAFTDFMLEMRNKKVL